jgi:hypothetical protein
MIEGYRPGIVLFGFTDFFEFMHILITEAGRQKHPYSQIQIEQLIFEEG